MTRELNYTQNGDYQIPNLVLKEESREPLGKYGRMRRTFLQENRPILYSDMVLTQQLFTHLREIDETAYRRLEQMMEELLAKNPAPEKKSQPMAWVQHMNSLKAQAEETILAELIYS
ncbi:MAG: TnpV protein [Lachnospiraceae bacterium]|nr:TnpV protein [Lachnospiraceae bacterium]